MLGRYVAYDPFWEHAPSDEEMIRNFEHDRPILEKILQMKRQDPAEYAFTTWLTTPQIQGKEPTSKREAQYRAELLKTHVQEAVVQYDKNTVLFSYYAWAPPSLDGKGYAYFQNPPTGIRLYSSLNNIELHDSAKPQFVFRHLDRNWYIYLCTTP